MISLDDFYFPDAIVYGTCDKQFEDYSKRDYLWKNLCDGCKDSFYNQVEIEEAISRLKQYPDNWVIGQTRDVLIRTIERLKNGR